MDSIIIEANYPVKFRSEDAAQLTQQLLRQHSVSIIGMKRVGISNFLRFYLNQKKIREIYGLSENYLLVSIDLNDLVEREIFPFWTLSFKRILDAIDTASLPEDIKNEIEKLFLRSIQTQDLFLLLDNVRKALHTLVSHGISPVLFFLRFDRIKDVVTEEFFDNLQGIRDATSQKVIYVFTSFRSLDALSPHASSKASLTTFVRPMYLRPAANEDMKIVYEEYKKRYQLSFSQNMEESLFSLIGGNIQFIQLALIILHELEELPKTDATLFDILVHDERITLQAEELWESLTEEEKQVLLLAHSGKDISEEDRVKAKYLWDTGFITEINGKRAIFNPLFDHYLKQKELRVSEKNSAHFSKKENSLFQYLLKNKDEICEREGIIDMVWPEYKEYGVSDWAIDRLVARVRSKIKQQKLPYEIQTIRTRGYKLQDA